MALLEVGELGCDVSTVLMAVANDIPPTHTPDNNLVALLVPILAKPSD